eukprot:689574-Rhodomonas_salina.1
MKCQAIFVMVGAIACHDVDIWWLWRRTWADLSQQAAGAVPAPRHSHAVTVSSSGQFYVFGGRAQSEHPLSHPAACAVFLLQVCDPRSQTLLNPAC